MTPEQTDLIKRSFDDIWPVRRKFASLFYRRFFELAPDTKHLFSEDIERQHLKLMDMIAAIVGALDNREMFQSIIDHTGRQHANFGVQSLHFTAFGNALIWSFEQQFGATFSLPLRKAWMALYDAIRIWPAPGSEDTELGVLMGPEVRHGETEVYARVQA